MISLCCEAQTTVTDSRLREDGAVRRRRQCSACGERFTTAEQRILDFDDIPGRNLGLSLTALSQHLRGMSPEDVEVLMTVARRLARAAEQPSTVGERAA
jgi:hypothetical protein